MLFSEALHIDFEAARVMIESPGVNEAADYIGVRGTDEVLL